MLLSCYLNIYNTGAGSGVDEKCAKISDINEHLLWIFRHVASARSDYILINPTALGKAKIVCNFGLSECNRVKNCMY